jgi:transposase InsO family protein
MALGYRQPEGSLLHHSDRGSQYTSDDFRDLLVKHGIACSMSARGSCYDNAAVESFFSLLKREPTRRDGKRIRLEKKPRAICSTTSNASTTDEDGTAIWDMSAQWSSRIR